MIVPSMSLPEIRKSVSADFSGEIKRKIESLKFTHQFKWIKNGKKDLSETILFPVKSKNNWRITVACNRHGVVATPYLVSYNNIGVTASHIAWESDTMSMMYFNTHFFKRYKERGKITIEKPEDVIKLFFKKNAFLLPCYFPREDGIAQLFTPLANGIGLGNYHEESDICEFKTFVDNSLLRDEQKEQIDQIYATTVSELMVELQRRIIKKQAKSQFV